MGDTTSSYTTPTARFQAIAATMSHPSSSEANFGDNEFMAKASASKTISTTARFQAITATVSHPSSSEATAPGSFYTSTA